MRGGSFLTNYVVDRRRVDVYREATIQGVELLDPVSGTLDFSDAYYQDASGNNGLPFREPKIVLFSVSGAASASSGQITLPHPAPGQPDATYTITFQLDNSALHAEPIPFSLVTTTPATGVSYNAGSATNPTSTTISIQVIVRAEPTPGPGVTPFNGEEFSITFADPEGASLDYSTYFCEIPPSPGGTPVTASPPIKSKVVRAPYNLRGTNVDYYLSSAWQGAGAFKIPFNIPINTPTKDTGYKLDGTGAPKTPAINFGTSPYTLQENNPSGQSILYIRQFIKILRGLVSTTPRPCED